MDFVAYYHGSKLTLQYGRKGKYEKKYLLIKNSIIMHEKTPYDLLKLVRKLFLL